MESCLNSSIEFKMCTNSKENNFFSLQLGFIFLSNAFRMVVSLDEFNNSNINFYDIIIL